MKELCVSCQRDIGPGVSFVFVEGENKVCIDCSPTYVPVGKKKVVEKEKPVEAPAKKKGK